jgi:hypothetical protein
MRKIVYKIFEKIEEMVDALFLRFVESLDEEDEKNKELNVEEMLQYKKSLEKKK